jgi:hypothetical protein
VSIIYDALQKTQRNRSMSRDHYQDHATHRMRWVDKGLLAAVVLLSGFVIYAYGPVVIKHFKQSASAKPAAAVAAPQAAQSVMEAAPTDLVLNGVLMSDQNQTAVINNQFYHMGDLVGGMRVVAIELNNVRLQDGNKIVMLKTNS